MEPLQGQMHLGSEPLANIRHVCALFDGPEAAYSALLPFVAEGIAVGNRIVYLTEKPETFNDRLSPHIASATVARDQLEIRPWAQTYLAEGRFIGSRMLSYIRDALRESSDLGYPFTRLIGEMEWAQDGVSGVEELTVYETGVEAVLGRIPSMVLCAYDVRRHSASRVAAVLAAHKAAF